MLCLAGSQIISIEGILTGTTNYILTRMQKDKCTYDTALREAQEMGIAETDPSLDVEGWDAKFKLCIITGHAYGLFLEPDEVFHYGISKISKFDIQYAKEKGFKKIALFGAKGEIGQVTREGAVSRLKKYGLDLIVYDEGGPTDVDVSAQFNKIRGSGAEAVIISATAASVGGMMGRPSVHPLP
jgi:hypothetical protein